MKRYAIVYLTEGGSAKLLTVDAIDESDARKQFWELYEGAWIQNQMRGADLRRNHDR